MKRERTLKELFDVGLAIKIATSALEVLAGFAILIAPRTLIVRLADLATAGELAEDPHDLVASWIHTQAHALSVHAHFLIAAYLFLRGLVKLVLAGMILRGHTIAYPLFIIALGIFASYEAYRSLTGANLLLGGIALFDTALIFLTAHEYRARGYSSQV